MNLLTLPDTEENLLADSIPILLESIRILPPFQVPCLYFPSLIHKNKNDIHEGCPFPSAYHPWRLNLYLQNALAIGTCIIFIDRFAKKFSFAHMH